MRKFGGGDTQQSLGKKIQQINRSGKKSLIVSTNEDGFNVVNDAKFAKLPCSMVRTLHVVLLTFTL